MRRVFGSENIRVAKGCNVWVDHRNDCAGFTNMISEGISYAENADITVLCLGLDCTIEGEETGMKNEYFDNGDKVALKLPKTQMDLTEEVLKVCDNVVIVLMGGGAIDLGEEVTSKVHAVIDAWYPGAMGGLAVAELIAGKFSPSGRLPITFYHADDKIPDFTDYNMAGRTYRYLTEKPLYPFGYGLSYTKFAYSSINVTDTGDDYQFVTVTTLLTGIGQCHLLAHFLNKYGARRQEGRARA